MKQILKTGKKCVVFLSAVILIFVCVIYYKKVKDGVLQGIEICTGTILPSLFPMMILTCFLTDTGIPYNIRRIVFYPIRLISGFTDQCAEIFFFGSIGGYPIGVKTAALLYGKSNAPLKDIQNAALINVNPGLAFSILVVGKQCFGSVKAGITLYASVCFGNMLLCLLLRRKRTEKYKITQKDIIKELPSKALVNAVNSAVKSTVNVSAWITAFTAFTALFAGITDSAPFVYFTEVTGAVFYCAARGDLPRSAFCMSFGGLCIFCQLLPDIRNMDISIGKYIICRVFSAVCAFSAEKVFLFLLTDSVLTAAEGQPRFMPFSGSVWLTGALAFLCAVFIVSNMNVPTSQKKRLANTYKI